MADAKRYKSRHNGPVIDRSVDKVLAAGDHPLIPDGGYDAQGAYRLQGSLDLMGESELTGLPAPVNGSDAANKEYVDKASGPSAESIPVAVAQSSDGKTYTATVEGITELKAGMVVMLEPNITCTSSTPTLDINGLGAHNILRGESDATGSIAQGEKAGWLMEHAPVLIFFDGSAWSPVGHQKPYAGDLTGSVDVKHGGTGKTRWTAGGILCATGSFMLGQVPAPEEDASLLVGDKTGEPYWAEAGLVLDEIGGARKSYVDDRAGSRENLLINWYFIVPINQRGEGEYTANGWTFDRWRKLGNGAKVVLSDLISGSVPRLIAPESGTLQLIQPVDINRMVYGKRYTLTLLYSQLGASDGTKLLTVTGEWDTDFEGENDSGLTATENGVVTIGMKSNGQVRIEVQPGITIAPHAIKLEQGEGQTLAWKPEGQTSWELAVPPPDMATELLKCQRHYQRNWVGKPLSEMNPSHTSNLIRTAIGEWVLGSVEFPVPMAGTPTVKLYTYKGTLNAANPVTDGGEPELTEIPCQAYKVTETGFIVVSSDGTKPFAKGDGYTFFYEAHKT